MPVFDKAADRIVVHVVYDGPAFAGKTTNLEQLCEFFTQHRRSELFTTQNAGQRTVYLDWLQLEGGVVAGRKLRCQMITVPGQTVLARRAAADVVQRRVTAEAWMGSKAKSSAGASSKPRSSAKSTSTRSRPFR